MSCFRPSLSVVKRARSGSLAVGLGEKVEEVEGAAGRRGEVGGDGRDDASGGAGDDEDALLAERHPGRPVFDRQLAHPDRGAEAFRVADLDAARVAERLLDEEVGDDGRRGVGTEVDRLHGRLPLLALERLGEAGDRAAERGDGARGVVAVAAAEARGRDEESARSAERVVERTGRRVEVLDADAERLAEGREVHRTEVALGVERREPEEAVDGAAGGPLGQPLRERFGRGAVLERQDVDTAGAQPLDESLRGTAAVVHDRDSPAALERDARRPCSTAVPAGGPARRRASGPSRLRRSCRSREERGGPEPAMWEGTGAESAAAGAEAPPGTRSGRLS